MRVALDTNALIAAFATRGLCEDVLRTILAEHELIVSRFILDELQRVLIEKLKMSPARARAITLFIRDAALVVDPTAPADWPEDDPDDRWIVATAIAGNAQVLVTGDADLLDTSADSRVVKVVSPRGFWERLR